MANGVKKSFYIFLSGFLGVLMFLLLHRILIFIYLNLLNMNSSFSFGLSYLELLALDYTTLFIALGFGLWYGIWLGLGWYEAIYEKGIHKGFVHHLITNYWPNRGVESSLEAKLQKVEQEVESHMANLETMIHAIALQPEPPSVLKKTVVRKKAPRRLKS